jgi:hypothetical protein
MSLYLSEQWTEILTNEMTESLKIFFDSTGWGLGERNR